MIGELVQAFAKEAVGHDKATQNAAKLPYTAAKSAIGLGLFAMIPSLM